MSNERRASQAWAKLLPEEIDRLCAEGKVRDWATWTQLARTAVRWDNNAVVLPRDAKGNPAKVPGLWAEPIAVLAQQTKLSASSVKRALDDLEQWGWIKRHHTTTSAGNGFLVIVIPSRLPDGVSVDDGLTVLSGNGLNLRKSTDPGSTNGKVGVSHGTDLKDVSTNADTAVDVTTDTADMKQLSKTSSSREQQSVQEQQRAPSGAPEFTGMAENDESLSTDDGQEEYAGDKVVKQVSARAARLMQLYGDEWVRRGWTADGPHTDGRAMWSMCHLVATIDVIVDGKSRPQDQTDPGRVSRIDGVGEMRFHMASSVGLHWPDDNGVSKEGRELLEMAASGRRLRRASVDRLKEIVALMREGPPEPFEYADWSSLD